MFKNRRLPPILVLVTVLFIVAAMLSTSTALAGDNTANQNQLRHETRARVHSGGDATAAQVRHRAEVRARVRSSDSMVGTGEQLLSDQDRDRQQDGDQDGEPDLDRIRDRLRICLSTLESLLFDGPRLW